MSPFGLGTVTVPTGAPGMDAGGSVSVCCAHGAMPVNSSVLGIAPGAATGAEGWLPDGSGGTVVVAVCAPAGCGWAGSGGTTDRTGVLPAPSTAFIMSIPTDCGGIAPCTCARCCGVGLAGTGGTVPLVGNARLGGPCAPFGGGTWTSAGGP